MKKVGAFEAKTHLSQLLTEVEQTQCEIVIQRRGKDVAVLGPCRGGAGSEGASGLSWVLDAFEDIRKSQTTPTAHEEIRELIEEGRRR